MSQQQYIKYIAGLMLGVLLIWIGVTGRLGSVLGALVTPDFMTNGQESGNTSGLETSDPSVTPITSGSTLSMNAIGALAYDAGVVTAGPGGLAISIAIAMAESGGRVGVTHPNSNGSTDYGLWQINSVHKQFDTKRLIADASYNATAMYTISSGGTNWTPWTTYTTADPTKSYRRFLSQAQVAAALVFKQNVGK